MDDDGDLVNVMIAIALAALVLVVGELYIVNRPAELRKQASRASRDLGAQHQLDRAP